MCWCQDSSHAMRSRAGVGQACPTNGLAAVVCLQIRQMEAEVVAMTAAMLNGGPGTSAPDACGAMTSGGTGTRAHSCRRPARTHTRAVQCAESAPWQACVHPCSLPRCASG